jgi:hypothetical protein
MKRFLKLVGKMLLGLIALLFLLGACWWCYEEYQRHRDLTFNTEYEWEWAKSNTQLATIGGKLYLRRVYRDLGHEVRMELDADGKLAGRAFWVVECEPRTSIVTSLLSR